MEESLLLDFRNREAVKICPICKKAFFIPDTRNWAYKISISKTVEGHKTLYFCKYSHKRQYETEHEQKLKDNRKKQADKTIKKRTAGKIGRPPEPEEDYLDKFCIDCRYCVKGKYGFSDCTVYSFPINPYKCACKRYRSKELDDV